MFKRAPASTGEKLSGMFGPSTMSIWFGCTCDLCCPSAVFISHNLSAFF